MSVVQRAKEGYNSPCVVVETYKVNGTSKETVHKEVTKAKAVHQSAVQGAERSPDTEASTRRAPFGANVERVTSQCCTVCS